MTKDEVAEALDEIGTLLELKGESSFRTNAYHMGARAVQQLAGDLKQMIADGSLHKVPHIGATLTEKITTLVATGRLPYLDELRASIPAGLVEMLRIQGLGPKKVMALHSALQIDSIAALKEACEAGTIAKLKGFGAKTQERILSGIAYLDQVGHRVRIDLALTLGESLLKQISGFPGVIRSALCGSVRRRRETIADLDILVSSTVAAPIMEAFVKLPEVVQVLAHGPTKSSILAAMFVSGEKATMQADLRVVTDEQYPFALLYFTGSKEHNIRLRQRAIDQGLSLNEYALASGKRSVKCKSEEEIYNALGLQFIEPELREDTGEIEAGEAKNLPVLVKEEEIRGVFHNHSTYSDGAGTLEEMALAAKQLGFEYFGIGDHSQSLTIARGLPPGTVRKQWAEIDRLNDRLTGIRILKGTEVDILEDGTLDYKDELLAQFDYVVASVHTRFQMTEAEMTARVCKALAHPAVTMLGHPSGRLLLKRDAFKLNVHEVLQCAARHGKIIEINAQPQRLDLDWKYVKQAKAMGIPLVINPDAHSTGELALFKYGVQVARRGWLTKDDVFNTRTLAQVLKELKRRKETAH